MVGWRADTYRSDVVLLSFALGDKVAGVHALLDLRRRFGQAFVQVSCTADVYSVLWRGRGEDGATEPQNSITVGPYC